MVYIQMIQYPTLTATPNDTWVLAEPWAVPFQLDDGRRGTVSVKAGFETDGASVPRMAWFCAGHPMESPRVLAALAHDWLYAAQVTTRKEADEIYAAILKAVGRASWRVKVEYLALRACGGAAWDKDKDKTGLARELGSIRYEDLVG